MSKKRKMAGIFDILNAGAVVDNLQPQRTQEEKIRASRKIASDSINELYRALDTVFKSEDGKIIMRYLENICFYNSSMDLSNLAFCEGARSVLLKIKDILKETS